MSGWRTLTKKICALGRNDSGVAAVEVAITMLPFLLVLFGTAEFGWFFIRTHTMNAAVSEGVRMGSTGQVTGTMTREDSIKQAIVDAASEVMVLDPASILIFPVDADWTDPDDPAVVGTANAGGEGAFMRVRVTYNHEFFTDLIGGFFGGTSTQMVTVSTYRNENFIL